MKRLFIFLSVVVSIILFVSMASADDAGARNDSFFIGLWEGVDPNDGSRRTVSISDNDRNGVFELTQYDTFWSLCGDDRGVAEGTATVGPDGTLNWEGTITCFTDGTGASFSVDYVPVRHSDILIESPVGLPLLPDKLHRVSTR